MLFNVNEPLNVLNSIIEFQKLLKVNLKLCKI